MTTAQTRFIDALTAKAEADLRIRAAWLAGSFGKGLADRWSDVDAHLLIESSALGEFSEDVEAWLAQIRPLVFVRRMFEGRMVNAMTDEAMRLDVWLHGGECVNVTEGETRVLFAGNDTLDWQPNPGDALTPQAAAAELNRAIPEFWRCISMLPVPVGRDEKLICAAGNFLILMLLTDVLSVGSARRRDRGVKALNGFLPPHFRRLAEDATFLHKLTHEELARFQLRLVRIMQVHGPAICAQWNVPYPHAMEEAVLQYMAKELRTLGLASAFEELEELAAPAEDQL